MNRTLLVALGAVALVAVASSCGTSGGGAPDGSVARVCAAGQQIACPCAGGGQGVQVCDPSGQAYEACTDCAGSDGASGSSSGVSSSSSGVSSGSSSGDASSDDATVSADATMGQAIDGSSADVSVGDGSTGDGFSGDGSTGDGSNGSCAGGALDCYVQSGCSTTLSGYVYDPAGVTPLYDATVFVPDSASGTIPVIMPGTNACGACGAPIGKYLAATTTDTAGHFVLSGVPATTHVPFVVQIGKWRREVFLPSITACTDNPVAADNSRLPTGQAEGDLPRMAILTGGADQLACFLSGLGIDSMEWTPPQGGGHVDVYQGVGGAGLTNGTAGDCNGSSCPLWDTIANLEYYDIALLGCEGSTNDQTKAAPAMTNMRSWLDEGGRLFATHFGYTWFKDGPSEGCAACTDLVDSADWLGASGGNGTGTYSIDTSFARGLALGAWLGGPDAGTASQVALNGIADSVGTVSDEAQRWIYDDSTGDTKVMTLITPIGATDAGDAGAPNCGKALFTDVHNGTPAVIVSGSTPVVPSSCVSAGRTVQQAALEFLFFDLSGCISDEAAPPPPPPPSL